MIGGLTQSQWAPTRQQVRIVDFILEYGLNSPERLSPSLEEIGAHVGIKSRAAVWRHVKILIKHGLLISTPRRHRSLRPAQRYTITIDFPHDLWVLAIIYARRANVAPDALIIEAFRDSLLSLRSRFGMERAA